MDKINALLNKIKFIIFASILVFVFAGCEEAEVLDNQAEEQIDEQVNDTVEAQTEEVEFVDQVSEEETDDLAVDIEIEKTETADEEETDSVAEPYNLHFIDAWGEWHDTLINPNAKMHDYNWDCLENDGQNISYEDEKYKIQVGVDVSSYLGDINWECVKNEGYEFAILRAVYRGYGESGSLNIDKKFKRNLEKAKENGFDVGVYVFSQAINEEEAVEEAEIVLNELEGVELELPIVFDPEHIRNDVARTDDVTKEQFTKNAIAFCDRVIEAGYTPMIYSNMIWEAESFDMQKLCKYKFWYADYEKIPQTPYAFEYWQFTEKGIVKGVDGYCDIDIRFIEK